MTVHHHEPPRGSFSESLLDAVEQSIIATDLDGIITYCNRYAEQLYGWPAGAMLGRSIMEVTPTELSRDRAREIMESLVRVERWSGEFDVRRRDGTQFRAMVTNSPIHDSAGQLVGIAAISADITERKAAEAALRDSQRFAQQIADTAPIIIYVHDLVEGRNLYSNRQSASIMGYTQEQMQAMGPAFLDRLIHPDDVVGLDEHGERLRRAQDGEVVEHEYRVRRADAAWCWLHSRDTVLERTDDGAPTRILGTAEDVTERKRVEAALRDSKERLRLGLDAGNTGTWDWDIVNNHVTWSERVYQFHGVKPGEFGGRLEAFAALVHPEDSERVTQEIQRCIREHDLYDIEFRVVHPTGEVCWIATSGKVSYGEDGTPQRMLGATSDITKRKLAEQERDRLLESERAARAEAERASRTKDEFLATLSHELRTPLNAMLGWVSLLQTGKLTPESMREGLASIERNARSQTQIVEDLLDLNRIMAGKVRLAVQEVDPLRVIEAALDTVRLAADARHIEITCTPEALPAPIMGDPNRLQQVLWNLLSNAIKFTPHGGHVEVALRARAGQAQITVRDTGEGIDPAFLPHVFERFRQADASTTRRHGGLGVGLALVKQLVEMHGGGVVAHSVGLGQGATFIVTLPLAPEVQREAPDLAAVVEGA